MFYDESAIEALAQLGLTDTLRGLAWDPSLHLQARVAAAQALGGEEDGNEGVQILLRLARMPQGNGIATASIAAGLANRQAFEELSELLGRQHTDDWMRRSAAQVLKTAGRTRELLAAAEDRGAEPEGRVYAASAAAELGCIDEATAVLIALARSRSAHRQERLVPLSFKIAHELLNLKKTAELMALVEDGNVDRKMREGGLWYLGNLDDVDVLGRIERLAATCSDQEVRRSAADAAATMRPKVRSARWRRISGPIRQARAWLRQRLSNSRSA
jgi:hypothetical protein